jgi:NOL1/NOP2/fmu family ribosome biogenesis protein
MQNLIILNTREIKKLRESITSQFGDFPKEDYAYLRNEKGKIYLINKEISKINLKNLKIDKMGLYFAEIKGSQTRLSKEGSQLIKPQKNILKLNKNELKSYFLGEDLKKDLGEENKLVILQFMNETIGCASYKEGKIFNFLPKIHRGVVII